MTLSPPLTPTDRQYTLFWCEENVYLLAQNFLRDAQIVSNWDLFAVFISNAAQTVALWNQKLAQEPGLPVVWDYHVILVLRLRLKNPGDQPVAWVYDFDTILSFPTSWTDYFGKTFSAHVLPNFQSSFRVIPANEYIDHFASDRSHMLLAQESEDADPIYLKPPPPYPCICGPSSKLRGVAHNLPGFISMWSTDGYGRVFSFEDADTFFSGLAI